MGRKIRQPAIDKQPNHTSFLSNLLAALIFCLPLFVGLIDGLEWFTYVYSMSMIFMLVSAIAQIKFRGERDARFKPVMPDEEQKAD